MIMVQFSVMIDERGGWEMSDDTAGTAAPAATSGTATGGPTGAATDSPSAFHITSTTTVADVLEALQRQGISDLEDFVERLLAKVEEVAGEEDEPVVIDYIIHEHYIVTHGERLAEEDQ
jgi:hypothetical protein